MAANFLKYTGIDYTSIMKSITDKLKADPRFDNFRESAIAQTINEIFAGTADLTNYYIQRQAEESFFETSKRDSSAILNSRNLAYDITRPIPANTTIKINIRGNVSSQIIAGSKLQLPVFTKFTYNGNDFILKNGFTYTFTAADVAEMVALGAEYNKTFSVDDDGEPITLIQGSLKLKIIPGDTNPQIGQIFQTYRIPDVTFSNLYGAADLDNYPTTRVWVGDSQSDENEYIIDRRSLINSDVLQSIIAGQTIQCALIRTAVDGDVELKFGTAKIAEMGADIDTGGTETTYDNIYIQYLSTIGTKANQTGVIDEIITCSVQVKVNSYNITSNVQFQFASNIVAGGDIETQESIKSNSPGIFYSLDRAVTVPDHVNILKTLTSPIKIKNARAWGEQEEARARNVSAIAELFNIGFFTCVGTLYNLEGDASTDTYSVKTNSNRIDESVLDSDFDENAMASQYYFNIFAKDKVARQLKEQIVNDWYWQIHNYTSVDVTKNYVWFADNYPTTQIIKYSYTSDKYLAGTSMSGNISVNVSAISSMEDIATLMETELRDQIDMRSLVVSAETNPNYGQAQFSAINVTWDSLNLKFNITNSIQDACHLDYVDPFIYSASISADAQNPFVTDLGLHSQASATTPEYAEKIFVNLNYNHLSSRIVEVIDTMTERGMITMKYVYASPVIHSFRVAGIVYADQLFSTDDLKRQINNQQYKFLDDNADFAVPIYKSNIIQVIEDFKGIDHADIRIEPDIPYPTANPSYRKTFYFSVPGYYSTIDKYGTDAAAIYEAVNVALYITGSYGYESEWREFIETSRTMTPDEIFNTDPEVSIGFGKLKNINERYFLSTIVPEIYSQIEAAIGESTDAETKFQDTLDFITMISDIHKDLCWAIRCNMIDSNGNIAPEYEVTVNVYGVNTKRFKRGGFSLGNEIAKINFDAVSVSTPATPYLSYQYK